jgi:hypothetical protein
MVWVDRSMLHNRSAEVGLAVTLLLLIAEYFSGTRHFLLTAIITLILAILWPGFFQPLVKVWFAASERIGAVASKIILTIIFFALVLPIGVIRRMSGYDSMKLKQWKKDGASVLVDRNHEYASKDFETPY